MFTERSENHLKESKRNICFSNVSVVSLPKPIIMPSYNIELNNKPIRGSNEYTLLLRITADRKHARLKLDYAVQEKHFNPNPKQNLYVRSSNSKHKTINGHIDEQIQKAKDAAKALGHDNKPITSKAIKQRMIMPKSTSFISYGESIVEQLRKDNNIGNSRKYKVVIQKLKDLLDGEDLLFQEIDVAFLNRVRTYLLSINNNPNTIHANFRLIRSVFYKAIDEGLAKQSDNPFFSFKLKLSSVSRTRLSQDEISNIEELDLPKESLIWHVKNAFLFSFYNAGIRASDLIQLQWKNIVNGRLTYQMHKTNKAHSLKLHDKPIKILDYYGPGEPDDYIFPFFKDNIDYSDPVYLFNQISAKTALLNKYLKQIATKAEINKKISTHTARHSFADIARKKTDNLYNLSKTLGHSSLKITEAYLASFDEDAIDDTLDSVFN